MTPTQVNDLVPLALIIFTLGYGLSCAIWPFKPCRRCHGVGKLRSPFLPALRYCPHCRGTGLRLRLGRKAWNAYRRLHHHNHRNRRGDDR